MNDPVLVALAAFVGGLCLAATWPLGNAAPVMGIGLAIGLTPAGWIALLALGAAVASGFVALMALVVGARARALEWTSAASGALVFGAFLGVWLVRG